METCLWCGCRIEKTEEKRSTCGELCQQLLEEFLEAGGKLTDLSNT